MKTSIVVPCFKNESSIANVLEDVENQTCHDWELIVVGNGPGQEAQRKIVESFAANDGRISYITLAEQGVSRARNKGIDESKGDWIAFVDADDRLPAWWLENYLSHASKRPDMIIGGISYRDVRSGKIRRADLKLGGDEFYSMRADEFTSVFLSDMAVMYSPCTKFYNARFLKDSGVRFKEDVSVYEDGIFSLELASVCNSMLFFRQTGYEYCRHPETSAIGRYHPNMEKAVKIRRQAMYAVLKRAELDVETIDRRMAGLVQADFLDLLLNLYREGSKVGFAEKHEILKKIFIMQELADAWKRVRPSVRNPPLVLFRFFHLIRSPFLCVLTFNVLFAIRKIWR